MAWKIKTIKQEHPQYSEFPYTAEVWAGDRLVWADDFHVRPTTENIIKSLSEYISEFAEVESK